MSLLARILTIALAATIGGAPHLAAAEQGEEEQAQGGDTSATAESRFLVLLPERIDVEWFWYYYTDEAQHIVQSAVEKALVRAGFDLIDVGAAKAALGDSDVSQLTAKARAIEVAGEIGARYVVVGQAVAVRAGHDVAYGVDVYRSTADITAKIIRVSDGKVLAVEDASATAGGQAQRTAGREALKQAGKDIAGKLVAQARQLEASE